MTELDIPSVSRRMIALYGQDAETVAAGTAKTYADCGDLQESLDWERVATAIAQLQHGKAGPDQ